MFGRSTWSVCLFRMLSIINVILSVKLLHFFSIRLLMLSLCSLLFSILQACYMAFLCCFRFEINALLWSVDRICSLICLMLHWARPFVLIISLLIFAVI